MDLSAGAARLLGYSNMQTIPVRIRRVNPPPYDQSAVRAGRAAAPRPDTPPVLLNALRKHLPGGGSASAASSAPVRSAPAQARAPAGRGYFVQVAALSNGRNAQALAQSMGGFVKPGGGLYRVQLGPFASQAQAEAARQRAAGAGYGDARVFAN
jgi:rare lipoprotein A